jgi:hypothetical protein
MKWTPSLKTEAAKRSGMSRPKEGGFLEMVFPNSNKVLRFIVYNRSNPSEIKGGELHKREC